MPSITYDFEKERTPQELAIYVRDVIDTTRAGGLISQARFRRGPFKKFREELLPFSYFCTWKYGAREDVLCSLTTKGAAGDALVVEKKNNARHLFEITWPIDGKKNAEEAKCLNKKGFTSPAVFSADDTDIHAAIIDRILKTARNKEVRDYRSEGESSIIFVLDALLYFWDNNAKHVELLRSLEHSLSEMHFLAEHAYLMIISGDRVDIRQIKHHQSNC